MATKSKAGQSAGNESTKSKAGQSASGDVEKKHYQEVQVQITKNVVGNKTEFGYEKLKVLRPCVKITDEQAEILNAGVLTGGNSYAKMYFKQGQ